jgi:[acyl-carrier-protein] S-malonyltransferase
MTIAFTFPGQGSQQTGMGRDLAAAFPEARRVFDEVDDALGEKLSALMFEGPDSELTLTANAQPALMAVSLAVIRVLEAEGLDLGATVKYVAGHSLGEYSALAAAGAIGVPDAARLLRIRGRAMQEAVPVGAGAMAALLNVDFPEAQKIAAEAAQGEVCEAANDNAPGQVVISGAKAAVKRAIEIAPEFGARRCVLLPVSAPFHCALMQPAADRMAEALASVEIKAPAAPLVANVLASAVNSPEEIRKLLVQQVTGAVRWRESVVFMAANGVKTVYELGAGRVLTGLARRIDRSLDAKSIGAPSEIEEFAATLASAS